MHRAVDAPVDDADRVAKGAVHDQHGRPANDVVHRLVVGQGANRVGGNAITDLDAHDAIVVAKVAGLTHRNHLRIGECRDAVLLRAAEADVL